MPTEEKNTECFENTEIIVEPYHKKKSCHWSEIAVFCAVPVLIVFMAFLIDPVKMNISSFFINFLLVSAVYLVVCAITEKMWIGWVISSLPVLIFEIIGYCKIKVNGSPLVLSDLAFGSDMDTLVKFTLPQLEVTLPFVLGILMFVALTVMLIVLEKKLSFSGKKRVVSACVGVILAAVLFVPVTGRGVAALLTDYDLSSEELVINNGVVGGLYLSFLNSGDEAEKIDTEKVRQVIAEEKKKDDQLPKNKKGKSTDKKTSKEPEEDGKTKPKSVKPTVIFLMSESFFDVNRLPGITFSQDPVKNFHRLQRECSTGDFYSVAYCGGTGHVEYEVLTGLCTYMLDEKDTIFSLPDDVYKTMPNINDVFKNNGYYTKYLHSHNSRLYNREDIYDSFGFDEICFRSDFKVPKEYDGDYVSDKCLTDEIINSYETSAGKPLMLYAVSMENHQPYTPEKYYSNSGIDFECDALQNEEDEQILDSYLHGLKHSDEALGELIEYFSGVREPVMIVFWGDHLPNLNLSDGKNLYSEIGYSPAGEPFSWQGGELLKMLTTDYIVWNNFGMKKQYKNLSCTMFGVEMLERLGFEMTDYFTWLSGYVKKDYGLYRARVFLSSHGEVSKNIPDKYKNMMNEYSAAVYDIAYGGNKMFRSQREQ